MVLSEHFLKEAIPQIKILHGTFPEDAQFAIDSRTVQPGDVFVALKGAHHDGHDFIAAALKAGARACIMHADKQDLLKRLDKSLLRTACIVLVPDTYQALYALAQAVRDQATCPIVAITGSVGKTSTKELLAHILQTYGVHCLVSSDNQNTQLGVALTLLRLRAHHTHAIFEVGISRRGEMARIAHLLRPTHAVITVIGHGHLEGLGAFADVALEKRAIFMYFTEKNIGIICGDQPVLAQVSYAHPVIKFGSRTTNQVQARKVRVQHNRTHFVLKIYRDKYPVTLEHTHTGAVCNILAATAAACALNVPASVIVQAVQTPVQLRERFEKRTIKGNRGVIIHDAYNANPESMKAALLAFSRIETTARRVVVLGDMLELGAASAQWHRQLGKMLCKTALLSRVILVGSLVEWTRKALPIGTHVDHVPAWQDAVPLLEAQLQNDALVLVKGSHGMQLEKLVNHFTT